MKKTTVFKCLILSTYALTVSSCNKEGIETPKDDNKETEKATHIVARFDGDDKQVYTASPEDLTRGSLTFQGNGYHLNPVRSARLFTDNLGWVYMFDYGGGYLKKLSFLR